MSERNSFSWWWLLPIAALTYGLLMLGTYVGRIEGRIWGCAEMKRWQDSYYAGEKRFDEAECAKQRINDFLLGERAIVAPAPPKKAKPAKASGISAREVLSPLFNMLDTRTTRNLTKFYITIPYVEGHWEIMATDRVNALLRLGSTSWTENEWKDCGTCQESKTVESLAVERWKNAQSICIHGQEPRPCISDAPLYIGDIDPQGAVCVAGSSDGHPIEIPCPQITWPTPKP